VCWGQNLQEEVASAKCQKPDGAVDSSAKRLASRFYQLMAGAACPDSISIGQRTGPPRSAGGAGTRNKLGSTSSRSALS